MTANVVSMKIHNDKKIDHVVIELSSLPPFEAMSYLAKIIPTERICEVLIGYLSGADDDQEAMTDVNNLYRFLNLDQMKF
jgi:hypothetical protein